MIITINKQWQLGPVWDPSGPLYGPQPTELCVIFCSSGIVASSKNTPNGRLGYSPRRCFSAANNSRLKFTSPQINQNLRIVLDLVVRPVSSIITVTSANLLTRAASRLVVVSEECSSPSVTQMSHIYQPKWLLKRQLPDVLHESEAMKAPRGRLKEQKWKPSKTSLSHWKAQPAEGWKVNVTDSSREWSQRRGLGRPDVVLPLKVCAATINIRINAPFIYFSKPVFNCSPWSDCLLHVLQDSWCVESFYSSFTAQIFQLSASREAKSLPGGSIPDVSGHAGVPPLNGVFSLVEQISPSDLPHCKRSVCLSSSVMGSVSLAYSLHSFLGSVLSPLCAVRHTFLPLVSCRIILSQPSIVRSCDLGLELTVSRLRPLLCGFFFLPLRLFCGS